MELIESLVGFLFGKPEKAGSPARTGGAEELAAKREAEARARKAKGRGSLILTSGEGIGDDEVETGATKLGGK